jgi:HdeA/HdeB family
MSIRLAELWYFYIRTVDTASDAAATVMPAETDFPCDRSYAMNGKTAFVLLSGVLSGLLCACVQPPDAAAPAAPTPPPVAAPAAAPAPAAEPTPSNRSVSIQEATCERLLELSPDDRAAASLFYTGYQAARFRSRTINVGAIPNAEEWAESYCAEHPGQPAVEAFRQAYRQTFTR